MAVEREEWKFDTLCDLYDTLTITQVGRLELELAARHRTRMMLETQCDCIWEKRCA